mgnify:CR=1 FL=1
MITEIIKTDKIFSDQKLADIYDTHDEVRMDLDPYIFYVKAFNAKSVLDVGCGTGEFLCKLAEDNDLVLYGVDPAEASLNVAMQKERAKGIKWTHGDMSKYKGAQVDLAVMTGNVAQVFLTDEAWLSTLKNIHKALKLNGRFVFESRRPHAKTWENWNREKSFTQLELEGVGPVERWVELTSVSLPFVSFRWHHHFKVDGGVLESDSTIIFREKEEIESNLAQAGFRVVDVCQAPDRPGEEYVFITEKSSL